MLHFTLLYLCREKLPIYVHIGQCPHDQLNAKDTNKEQALLLYEDITEQVTPLFDITTEVLVKYIKRACSNPQPHLPISIYEDLVPEVELHLDDFMCEVPCTNSV